ncbi:MAG: exodeoxyribonuclease VII large subunit [Acidobacteria bacterium]|nr:MAG: exodeoxyribonuclease VII large subunit [Acidobacteriota bacterium]
MLNDAYTVTEITRIIKAQLEVPALSRIWVVGEISSLSSSQAGHIYFSLKDENGTVLPCTFFANFARSLDFQLENGSKIYAFGMITVYDKRGSYQLNVMKVVPSGEGELALKLKQLKEKLQKEGLFDENHKKPVPAIPDKIGLITSPKGAAIRDFMRMIQTAPMLSVMLFPASVQGAGAAASIIRGIEILDKSPDVDVIVITRGGGSEEDLFCFNDELLARTIFDCETPIVSAIGHEKDTPISDLVADLRLPTPTAAGRHFAENVQGLMFQLQKLRDSLATAMLRQRDRNPDFTRFSMLTDRLQDQLLRFLPEREQQLDTLANSLITGINRNLEARETRFQNLEKRLHPAHMRERVAVFEKQLQGISGQLTAAIAGKTERLEQRLHALTRTLNAVNPLNVLDRGFTASFSKDGKKLLRSVTDIRPGDTVNTRFVDGFALCHVLYTEKKEPE